MAFPYVKIGPWTNGSAPALSAANMTLLDDGIFDAQNPPNVRVRHSTTQATADATYLTLTFDTEEFDTHAMHSTGTNPTRLTSVAAGYYLVIGQIGFAANATGYREAMIFKGGTTVVARAVILAAPAVPPTHVIVTGVVSLASAEYVELRARQNSTGALNVTGGVGETSFSATRIA